jgi:PAS domain S-box-containing protein
MTSNPSLIPVNEWFLLGWSILIVAIALWLHTVVEVDLWHTLRRQRTESRVGHALTYRALALAISHAALGLLFFVFSIRLVRDDDLFILPLPGRLVLYAMVVVTTLAASAVGLMVRRRLREHGLVTVDEAGVFATLARAMPMVVADCKGTIQYATPSLDALVGAAQDELTGQNITILMPERWRAQHCDGLERYLTTGESRIMGRVVHVDVLRRDGTEIPASLALASSEVDGEAWFVGALWVRSDEEYLEGNH